METITDIKDPRIQPYRSLRGTPSYHEENDIFIAEGEKVVLKLLNSGLEILSVFAQPEYYEKYEIIISDSNVPDDDLFRSSEEIMEKIVGFRMHQGIMAIGKIPSLTEIPRIELPAVAMNGIIDSENVGSIIRNAAAFGYRSVIFDKKTSSPWLRRAVRVSMGTIFSMQYHSSDELSNPLKSLIERRIPVISCEISDYSQDISGFDFPVEHCLVFGSEGHGIDKDISGIADAEIMIPVTDKVESLNVAASSAVIMHGARKKFIKR